MNANEVNVQTERLALYQKLEKTAATIHAALAKITMPWAEGPHGQGPFTGNARESRQVKSMHIVFTATRGGAAPVKIELEDLYIEAWELGQALEGLLRARLEVVNAEMEKL